MTEPQRERHLDKDGRPNVYDFGSDRLLQRLRYFHKVENVNDMTDILLHLTEK